MPTALSSSRSITSPWFLTVALQTLVAASCFGNSAEDICLLEALNRASPDATVSSVREQCDKISIRYDSVDSSSVAIDKSLSEQVVKDNEQPPTGKPGTDEYHQSAKLGAVGRRRALEDAAYQNRFALEPHRPNYLLPFVYSRSPNQEPFAEAYNNELDNREIQFQISIKTTLAKGVLFGEGTLYAGYTGKFFWQAYNSKISRPFRETNHEPEVWVDFDSKLDVWGFNNVSNGIGVNHQSNGQSGDLSRSWNRVFARTVWERDSFAFALTGWYRIPEDEDDYPGDPDGDDNPDIEDYLGNGEFQSAYSVGEHTVSLKLRNYFSGKNHGATELGWSFPLGKRVGGYIKYFNGYGESLIDYNVKMETLGIGIELNDWL